LLPLFSLFNGRVKRGYRYITIRLSTVILIAFVTIYGTFWRIAYGRVGRFSLQ
jgi:hypothetical protein